MVIVAKDVVREPLYAIVPHYNPWQWKSRQKHTERAIKHFIDSGATVVLVEIAFNRREFVFEDSGIEGLGTNCDGVLKNSNEFKCKYIKLRASNELWLKENAINIGVTHLPTDWQQVCWLDSDVHFLRPNWVGRTIQELQHYKFVQMFSHARDLDPNYEMLPEKYPHADGLGFIEAWKRGVVKSPLEIDIDNDIRAIRKKGNVDPLVDDLIKDVQDLEAEYYKQRVWPGLAWACTKQGWEDVGGLLDVAIWGGGDWHMAHALIEKTEGMMRNDLHRNYKKIVNQWYQRCRTNVRRNVGVVEGSIVHHWHGKKVGRGYNSKHAMLANFGFDPPRHLKRDFQGVLTLHDDRSTAYVQIRDMMRNVARERNEDSIDV